MSDKIFCNNCGAENPIGAKFCCGCGMGLNNTAQEENQIQQPVSENANTVKPVKRFNTSGIVMLCIGILLVLDSTTLFNGEFDIYNMCVGLIYGVCGIYFMFHKKKYHWVIYIITILVMGICRFIFNL